MTQQFHSKNTNSKRYVHSNTHSNITDNFQGMEATCPPTDEWVKMMWYIYNGIILSPKKENLAICSNMDRLGGHYAVRQILLWYHLYVESEKIQQTSEWKKQKKRKQTHTENKPVAGHQWGEAKGVIMEVYEIVCVKHLKIVKHYKI